MEYLEIREILSLREDIEGFFSTLLSAKVLVAKPKAAQWRFLRCCFDRLFMPGGATEFDMISKPRSAQLKFELENKLKWFYLSPGKSLKYALSMIHKSRLSIYGFDQNENYPDLAGYCLLIRKINEDASCPQPDDIPELKSYLERVVIEGADAEFRAYSSLPEIREEELYTWFHPQGPAIKEILLILHRHSIKGRVINNPFNPSSKRIIRFKVDRIGKEECLVRTTEYWYLRWWNTHQQDWDYPYRETNIQKYVLKKHDGKWKIFQNLRPAPRTSAPLRQLKSSRQ